MAYFSTRKKKDEYLPGGVPGAVEGVNVNGDYQQKIKDQMADNSLAWHTAETQEEKDALHTKNEALAQLLGSDVGFDASSGKWSGTASGASSSAASFGAQGGGYGSFSYQKAPEYVSRYQDSIDELTRSILGREAFSYDPEQDPLYQQYRQSYTRGGQRAMQDTLGQVSARTGGLASSYAAGASQQAYDNYMAGLADKIPELYRLAYSMYQDEGNEQRANLNMLTGLEREDYGKYSDRLSQYNTDRAFSYGVHRDDVANGRYEQEYADSRADTEYARALNKAQTLAAAGDFSGYEALGYSAAEIANMKAAYDAAKLLGASSGRSGGGGSGGGKVTGNTPQAEYGGQTPAERLAKNALQWAAQQHLQGNYDADPKTFIDRYYKEDAYKGVTKGEALSQLEIYQQTGTGYTEYAWQRATAAQSAVPESSSGPYSDFSDQTANGLFAAAYLVERTGGNAQSFIANNAKKYGFYNSGGLMKWYQEWKDKGAGAAVHTNSDSGQNRTSLDHDPDEGIFTWQGKRYSSAQKLLEAMEAANLSDEEQAELERKFKRYGFDISF